MIFSKVLKEIEVAQERLLKIRNAIFESLYPIKDMKAKAKVLLNDNFAGKAANISERLDLPGLKKILYITKDTHGEIPLNLNNKKFIFPK